ncbi:hypothetical protein RIF29_14421 [Crotalaria pallida]|uniref:Uncharacterized protein n=1 Tax=Crotalaria pallida TaxID=3830 RepID=A0AAN9FB99_CROPI
MKHIQHVADALTLKKNLKSDSIPEENIDRALFHVEAVIGSGAPPMKPGDDGATNGAIIVSCPKKNAFKYFNMWAQYDGFLNLIQSVWQTEVHGYLMFQIGFHSRSIDAEPFRYFLAE